MRILGIVAAILFAIVGFRLWALQVISSDEHLEAARNNIVRTVRLDAPRGEIVDRNGNVLVRNTAGTVVRLWPAQVPDAELPRVIRRLSELLAVPASAIRERIEDQKGSPLEPVTVKVAVRDVKVDYINEHLNDFPGVEIALTQLREYPQGTLAAHLVGHVAEINGDQLKARDPNEYRLGDRIGQAGIEFTYDRYLRGLAGEQELRFDANNRLIAEPLLSRPAQPGKTVRLTLDAELQRAAEDALTRGIRRAQAQGAWAAFGGAVVALDPRDGAILALASSPRFRPSIYSGRPDQDRLDNLWAETRNEPGVNRAISGVYPPGSTFKPVVALAAMAEQNRVGTGPLFRPTDQITCSNSLLVDGQRFKNFETDLPPQGISMDMPNALATSCDTFFYLLGLRFYHLPEERGSPLQYWARRFGFGEPTGIDIRGSEPGLLPDPSYLERRFANDPDPAAAIWKSGDSVQLAIGQGYMLATPLQMARFYALLANGGKLVSPHLGMQVEEPGAGDDAPQVLRRLTAPLPRDLGLAPESIDVVREGLWDATHELYGTSYSTFGRFPVPVAGKTGTAEKYQILPVGYPGVSKKIGRNYDQAWWCGYGPVGKYPQQPLVVCAVVENGGKGGDAAAPVARDVFAAYWGVDASEYTFADETAEARD